MQQLGYLGIDQYGQHYILKGKHPRKALMDRLGATHAEKMYVDTHSCEAQHIGYVVRGLWVNLYAISEWQGAK